MKNIIEFESIQARRQYLEKMYYGYAISMLITAFIGTHEATSFMHGKEDILPTLAHLLIAGLTSFVGVVIVERYEDIAKEKEYLAEEETKWQREQRDFAQEWERILERAKLLQSRGALVGT